MNIEPKLLNRKVVHVFYNSGVLSLLTVEITKVQGMGLMGGRGETQPALNQAKQAQMGAWSEGFSIPRSS